MKLIQNQFYYIIFIVILEAIRKIVQFNVEDINYLKMA